MTEPTIEEQFELDALRKAYSTLTVAAIYARDNGLTEIKVGINGGDTVWVPAARHED